jgi:hypothetical protein
MEGKSLSGLILLYLLIATSCFGQSERRGRFDPSSFLEPNRFSIVKDLDNPALWLIAGFGHVVLPLGDPGTNSGLGLEGLIWSRLRALPDFRFPVETADYFFGAYVSFGGKDSHSPADWRLRVSHISSHLVDGTDSAVVGGSSSRYSREFIELSKRFDLSDDVIVHAGARWLFHQVQAVEPSIALPVSISWRFYNSWSEPVYDRALGRSDRVELSFYATSAYGPSWPSFGGGVISTVSNDWLEPTDLKVYYIWGAPWAGVEAAKREGALRAELSVHAF